MNGMAEEEKIIISQRRGPGGKFMKVDKVPEDRPQLGPHPVCNECARKDLYMWLEELYQDCPMPDNLGFGKHNDYVQGVVDGIGYHIKGVIAELKKFERDMLRERDAFEDTNQGG